MLRQANHVALRKLRRITRVSLCVGNVSSARREFSAARVVSLKLEWSIADCGINAYGGRCM